MNESNQIGGFTIQSRLGEGDFATVYRVSRDEHVYALKLSNDRRPIAVDRIRNEISVLQMLSHESIPEFVRDGEDEGRPFLVMSLARGRTLKQLLEDQLSAGAFPGDLTVLRIVAGLLRTLEYLHGEGWVHRDVKSANVLVTEAETRISLIDFGFSKRDGESEVRTPDSFFRVGAALYSPPEKLETPGVARASHDVFAVGVVGYHLLTGGFPWFAESGDVGRLKRLMLSQQPTPISGLNSTVRQQVSAFIMSLLEVEESRRVSAAQAAEQAEAYIDELSAGGHPQLGSSIIEMPHVTRDPIHGDIRLTTYEKSIMNTQEMQRLRWIRQLGLTNMVFLGAEHTRLSHSVGSLQRVEHILTAIEQIEGVRVDRDTRLVGRLYALVHDVFHVPFGHSIEDELGIFTRHDENLSRIRRLMLDETTELGSSLRLTEIGREVLAHFEPEASVQERSAVKELVSGSTGADVLDYIDRDSFFCGLHHRVDSALFRQLRLRRGGGQEEHVVSLLYGDHGIRVDRSFAVESLLRERYALFLKVYTHKRKAAATALLGKALNGALHPTRGRAEFLERSYEWMGDEIVVDRLSHSRRGTVSSLATSLRRRHLPTPAYRAQLLPDDPNEAQYRSRRHDFRAVFAPRERIGIEAQLARAARCDSSRLIVYCPPTAPGYQRVQHWISAEPGTAQPVDHVQRPFLQIGQLHLNLWELWVFYLDPDPGDIDRIGEAAENEFQLPNQIHIDRRQQRLFFTVSNTP